MNTKKLSLIALCACSAGLHFLSFGMRRRPMRPKKRILAEEKRTHIDNKGTLLTRIQENMDFIERMITTEDKSIVFDIKKVTLKYPIKEALFVINALEVKKGLLQLPRLIEKMQKLQKSAIGKYTDRRRRNPLYPKLNTLENTSEKLAIFLTEEIPYELNQELDKVNQTSPDDLDETIDVLKAVLAILRKIEIILRNPGIIEQDQDAFEKIIEAVEEQKAALADRRLAPETKKTLDLVFTKIKKTVKSIEKEQQCIICFEYVHDEKTRCCKKSVHTRCLMRWLSQHDTCPNCRAAGAGTGQ